MKYLRVILIILLLVCCTLWVASYWGISWVSSDGLLDGFLLHLLYGEFVIGRYESHIAIPPSLYGLTIDGYAGLPTNWWPVIWIYHLHLDLWTIRGTFWLPTLLLALSVAISESQWAKRRRRAKQGLCIRCGYDLSDSESGVCSECGVQAK